LTATDALGAVTTSEVKRFICPCPIMATTSWLLEVPYGMVRVPVVEPATAGVKTTVAAQEPDAAIELPQVFAVMA
jgi:hypothetical protein